ncbi:imidazolonepropionase [Psychrobium sp. 1_MG-2023]|uniref:imidazolonepropionase n=1 Tax=Psychrobium sp. 1_MG-2023 TaxID=3062624 RepID=UPI000C3411E9|nr:imidazolonepropionase [Psychrobium sp. 1_MG-2023]MDP2561073.1 imidazolonepropionase [Psychrobium sp. 1_MG-2023]PKF58363.1 imidazolonepropionase [Alteromonadales bacterium alter-6D02]
MSLKNNNVFDSVWVDINLATINETDYGIIEDAALAIKDGKIAWLGAKKDLPEFDALATPLYQGRGAWVTPGLIDCHSHIVYGGDRAKEFEMRLEGASYQDIAAAGGGIVSTVKATREADEETLYVAAKNRLNALMKEGVTTVEIKSGYGLDVENELKMLRIARLLGQHHPVDVKTTFLGAHALPPEFKDNADGYIDLVCGEMLEAVVAEDLADAVDAFCESVGFNLEQTRRVFDAAKQHGLPVKLHAEQMSNLGGSELAASYQGLSVDHIEYLDEQGVKAIKAAGTVAVVLPGAFYFLRETQQPPIELLRQHQVPMAIATDANPGSSPLCSIQLMLNMACTLFRMTPYEALAGVTIHAAKALGVEEEVGTLEVGKQADFVVWDINHPAQLAYQFGVNPCQQVIKAGNIV